MNTPLKSISTNTPFTTVRRLPIAIALATALTAAITGCANNQTWNSELGAAQALFDEVSQHPDVARFAPAQIQTAEKQLQRAEQASDYFADAQTVTHESRLAKTQILIAQQRARAARSRQNLQIAMQTQKQVTEQLALATESLTSSEPNLAAALPANDTAHEQSIRIEIKKLRSKLSQLENELAYDPVKEAAKARLRARQLALGVLQSGQSQQQPSAAMSKPDPAVDLQLSVVANEQQNTPAPTSPPVTNSQPQIAAAIPAPTIRPEKIVIGDRYFDNANSARLVIERAERHLYSIVRMMEQNSHLKIAIEGHTNNVQPSDLNHNLSIDRAISLKSALILRGIEPSRVSAVGFGETRPVASNETEYGRIKNQRVELIFTNL